MAPTDKAVTLLWLVLPQVLLFFLLAAGEDAASRSKQTLTLHPKLVKGQEKNVQEVMLPPEAFEEPDNLWEQNADPEQQARQKRQTIERPQGLQENINLLPPNSTTVVSNLVVCCLLPLLFLADIS